MAFIFGVFQLILMQIVNGGLAWDGKSYSVIHNLCFLSRRLRLPQSATSTFSSLPSVCVLLKFSFCHGTLRKK